MVPIIINRFKFSTYQNADSKRHRNLVANEVKQRDTSPLSEAAVCETTMRLCANAKPPLRNFADRREGRLYCLDVDKSG